MLTYPAKEVIESIDEDLKIWQDNLKHLLNEKERNIQKMQRMFKAFQTNLDEASQFFDGFKPAKTPQEM